MERNGSQRILVVDDEPASLKELIRLLRSAGYETTGAATGGECLRLVPEQRPDLVILDAALPDTDGKEICRIIKANPDTSQICVLLLSDAVAGSGTQDEELESGADGYMMRPIPEREILARVKALLRMKNSEQRLQEVIDFNQAILAASSSGMAIVTPDGHVLTANETMASLLKVNTDELLGENFWESSFWKSAGIRDHATAVLSSGIEKRREARLVGQSGGEMWVDWRVSRLMARGQPFLLLMANDITQWKLAEQRSALAAQEWERTFDAVPDTIMILDEQQRIIRMNKAASDRCGVSSDLSEGKFCFEVVHGKEHCPSDCPFKRLREDSGPHSEEIVDEKLGGVFEVRVSPVIDAGGNLMGCVHVARDVTEHKRLQEKLTKNITELTTSREQTLAVTKSLGARLKELNCLYGMSKIRENDCLSFNELFQAIVNIIPAAWQYPDFACARLVLAGHEFRTANFRETKWNQKVGVKLEGQADGFLEVCYLEATPDRQGGPFRPEERRLLSAIAERTGRIMDQFRAQEALREREEFLRQVTENIQEVFWLTEIGDVERVLYVSPAFERVWGISTAELKENPRLWVQGIHENERESVRAAFEGLTRGEKGFDVEYRVVRPDGSTRWLWDRGFIIESSAGKRRVTGMALDITQRKLAEEALRESEARFKTVVSSLMDGVMTFDASGAVRLFNPSACRMFGYDDDTIGTMNIRDLLSDPHKSDNDSGLREYQRGPHASMPWDEDWIIGNTREALGIRSDGTEFPLELSMTRISAEGLPRLLGMFRDITVRKTAQRRLQERERELRHANHFKEQLLATAATAIFTIDSQGLVTGVNKEFESLTGFLREEVAGRPCSLFCRAGEATECWVSGLRADGSVFRRHNKVRTKAGRLLTVLQNATPLSDEKGKMIGMVESFVDITEIIEARKAAEQASRLKSAFLANMSHEIRTPLNAVIGMTELAMDEPLEPKVREYLSTVRHSSRLLLQLLNDVLDFSRIEAGKLDFESTSFDLEDLLGELRSLCVTEMVEKDIEFHIWVSPDIPTRLVGDPFRLKQILLNLAGNAFKFTQRGEIMVRVTMRDSDNDIVTLVFAVKDTGMGIPASKLSSIFDSFTQADSSTSRSHGGSGLGLTICGSLVSLMGGSMWVESEPGKGSTFSFAIPLSRQGEQCESRYVLPDALAGNKVLVVDANDTSMTITQQCLKQFSLNPSGFKSLADALADLPLAAKTSPYELVILTGELPDIGMKEAVALIQQHGALVGLRPKVIVIHRFTDREEGPDAWLSGADASICKPILRPLLHKAILQAFGLSASGATVSRWIPDRLGQHRKLLRGARLLVVEDNVSNQQVAHEILRRMGVEVTIANSGVEALAALDESCFDSVLMDVEMPEIDGFETTRRIRADKRFRDLPIIAMTAHAMKGDRDRCLAAGMNDYVSKPLSQEALVSVLKVWTRQCGLEHEEEGSGESVAFSHPPKAGSGDLHGIDVPSALDRLIGDEQLLHELLREFGRDFRNAAADILEAWQRQDYATARRLAHSVKGVSGNLSAMDVYAAAAKLEQGIQDRDDENVPQLHDHFRKMLSIVLESIDRLQEEPSDRDDDRDRAVEVAESPDAGKVNAMLEKLSLLLWEHDPEALEFATNLERTLGRSASQETMKKMRACLDRYDFDGAARTLESIVQTLKSD